MSVESPLGSNPCSVVFLSRNITWCKIVPFLDVTTPWRSVKAADSKSAGVPPRRFESCRCRAFTDGNKFLPNKCNFEKCLFDVNSHSLINSLSYFDNFLIVHFAIFVFKMFGNVGEKSQFLIMSFWRDFILSNYITLLLWYLVCPFCNFCF